MGKKLVNEPKWAPGRDSSLDELYTRCAANISTEEKGKATSSMPKGKQEGRRKGEGV